MEEWIRVRIGITREVRITDHAAVGGDAPWVVADSSRYSMSGDFVGLGVQAHQVRGEIVRRDHPHDAVVIDVDLPGPAYPAGRVQRLTLLVHVPWRSFRVGVQLADLVPAVVRKVNEVLILWMDRHAREAWVGRFATETRAHVATDVPSDNFGDRARGALGAVGARVQSVDNTTCSGVVNAVAVIDGDVGHQPKLSGSSMIGSW